MALRGILFDLDGTLLDIDIDAFLRRYFAALSDAVTDLVDGPADHKRAMEAIYRGTGEMMAPHPGETNREAFYRAFLQDTGIDLDQQWGVFERFYDDVFPTLQGTLGPRPGAVEAFEMATECGALIAIATNPIFPLSAVSHRLKWAGIDPTRPSVITSFETMTACKPSPEYYRQTCEMLGLDPTECLMVGDDRMLDLPAADIGLRTFYVGPDPDAPADYRGDMELLARELPRLCAP